MEEVKKEEAIPVSTPQKRDWNKLILESEGSMARLPESMIIKTEEFKKRSDEYLTKAKEFDKLSAGYDIFAKNFWHEVRNALEESGTEEVWGKNIGFNKEAEKENINIINIVKAASQGMQMR